MRYALPDVIRSLGRFVCLVGLAAVFLCTASRGGEGSSSPEADDDEVVGIIEHALEPWTGTFDQMIERRLVRVAIPVGLTTYFMDGKDQRGPTYDLVQEFEKHLKKTLGRRARNLSVVVIPARRDQVLAMVVDGRADITAGILTVTAERAERVDFSPPFRSDVDEVVVTRAGMRSIKTLDDLVGPDIHVRRSTTMWGTLERLNLERKARGAAPLSVVAADELLRPEDLLEMVAAGVIPATVSDSPVAALFARTFDGLIVHTDLPLAKAGSYAWAHRKGDAKLNKALAGFVQVAAKGTYLGNVILGKYTKDTQWIQNVREQGETAKFSALVEYFKTYAGRYDFDWLMVAAQGYQESRLDQTVRSHVGAIGVMQVLPTTARDPVVGIPDIEKLEPNIHAGIKYLNHLRTEYLADPEISELDRTLMSFAAYNAGPGNLARARRLAKKLGLDPDVWFDNVETAMGRAAGREPVVYVRNIYKYYTAFKLIAAEAEARAKVR